MARPLWCACGSAVPWSWDIWSAHNSQHLWDPYSFTHVLHGFAFFAAAWLLVRGWPFWKRFALAGALETLWEVVENSPLVIERYRATAVAAGYFGDSLLNSASDVGACLLGFWLASRLPWRATAAAFVAVELALVASVRDSLILSSVQLVYPVAALSAWQAPPPR
ncbi:MAG: DUF2585 family protein [Elusimicrobia bacterium]|nr:DUF2585 family protein [Elusimicrobiota bacterium]